MRRSLFFLFFVSTLLSLPAIAKRATQGFKLAKLEICFPNRTEWEVPLDPQVLPILQQRFFYLAKGAQCYVFESEDRRFVIKLFRCCKSLETLFDGCKIAYDHLREETALLYVHLNASPDGLPVLKCTDPVGRRVQIPLNAARFAIQKRGEPFFDSFEKAVSHPDQMKRQIDGFVELLISRAKKGVLNTDRSLGSNFGFIGSQAVEFDFGNYRLVPGLDVEKEVRRYTTQLEKWLNAHAPEWGSYIKELPCEDF